MKTKNITIVFSKLDFSDIQLERLSDLGKVTFARSLRGNSPAICPKYTEILVLDSFSLGSPDKRKIRLKQLLDTLPNVRYLVLGNSDCSFVDTDYCKQRNIVVSVVPLYDAESKAEHIIALLLGSMRRIIINDRLTYRRMFYPGLGHNFKGSRLGIIGMDSAGEQVASLAKALGAVVSVCERQIRLEAVSIKTLDSLLVESDMIALRLAESGENIKFLGKERINQLKDGVIVVNTGNRSWVDEKAMNEALRAGKVGTYAFEAETMGKSPLKGNDFALIFKPFSTYTKETREKNIEAMVTNIEGIVRGMPYSKLEL